MLKNRDWIAAHIPHQGTMCLLDGVLDWNLGQVRCVSRAHRDPDNPLRRNGQLSAVCGIEFAAQAMAVHGALVAATHGGKPRAGLLASLRLVEFEVMRLDDIEAELIARVWRQGGDDAAVMYDFALEADGLRLLQGRSAMIVTPAELIGPSRTVTA